MAADILVLPGAQSETGLAEGPDLLAQDFLLAMLNYGEPRPYLPVYKILPITKILTQGGNVPAMSEIAMAFGLSLPGIRNIMQATSPTYRGARLTDLRPTSTLGEVSMTIRIQTSDAAPVYVQKTFTIGINDG